MSKINIKKDFNDGDKLFATQLNNNFKVIEEGVNANESNLQSIIDEALVELQNELEQITADRGWDWNGGDRVLFFKGSESDINLQPIKNGQLLYDIETKATYLDNNNERIVLSTGTIVDTEMSDTSSHAIANKTVKKYIDDNVTNINDNVTNINETIGDLDNLNTTNKDSIVSAVNDVYGDVSILKSEQKLLWSGGIFMQEGQVASLSENISAQKNGIVLVWSAYSSDTIRDYYWNVSFIPKKLVEEHSGIGIEQLLTTTNFGTMGCKYIYIDDDEIRGSVGNNTSGTAASNIKYDNRSFVLRYVIGV